MSCSGQSPALQQLPKELQDLVSELIEEAEFKGKQVMLKTEHVRAWYRAVNAANASCIHSTPAAMHTALVAYLSVYAYQ